MKEEKNKVIFFRLSEKEFDTIEEKYRESVYPTKSELLFNIF